MILPGSIENSSVNKKRKRLYDHARLTKNSRDWEAYKKIKNKIIIDLKQAHGAYCKYMFNTRHSSNCKRFWSYIKYLRHDFSNIATLRVNNKELLIPSDKANALNDHSVCFH